MISVVHTYIGEYVDMYASEAKLILMKKRRNEAREKKREEG